jgi:hypothetical protein
MFIVEQSLELPRSAEQLFAFLSEPRNELQWRSDLRDVRVLTDGPLRVGSQIQTEVAFLGRQYPVYEVTAFEPPRREVLVGRSGPLRGSVITYLVEPIDVSRCRFTLRFEVRPAGLLRLAEPIMGAPFKRELAKFVANLERVFAA